MGSDKAISTVTTLPMMSFRLFLLCCFVVLARPQDILTFLQPMRPALVLIVLATGAMVFGGRLKEISAALSTAESKRYFLFFLIMIVGIPFAFHRGIAFEHVFLGYVFNMLLFVLLVSQLTSLQRLKNLVWVICLCSLMYSVFGGVLRIGDLVGGRFHVAGSMFDPNDTAYVLVSLFPLCLYFIRFDEGLLKKLVAILAVCSAFVIILLTGSRGGILGLGTVMLILLLTKMGGIKTSYKMLLAVVLASAFLLMRDKIDVERYLTLSDISSDYNMSSSEGRIRLWESAIDLSLANPVTGVGVACFAFANFFSRVSDEDSYRGWQDVHNSFLQVAVEVGLIGFVIFALIILRSLVTFYRVSRVQVKLQSRETSEMSALGGLMFIGFAGLLVSGFFLTQGYSIYFTLYFGLAAAMGRLQTGLSAGIVGMHGAADTSAVSGWRNSGNVKQSGAR